VFIAASIGQLSLQEHVTALCTQQSDAREDALQTICLLDREKDTRRQDSVHYQEFLQGNGDKVPDEVLASAEKKVGPDDVINLQFTSGKWKTRVTLEPEKKLLDDMFLSQ
jgi:hypothetical protein